MQLNAIELTVPAGVPGDPQSNPTVINLQAIAAGEARQDEVASLTPIKAPELLTVLNRYWRDIHQIVARLENEKNKAEKAADRRKGVLLLEVIPRTLEAKGIASAADTRKAVIDTDDEYTGLVARFDQITAAITFLKGKLKSFENAYASVKKIIGEDAFNMAAKPNSNLSGGTSARGASSVSKPAPASPSVPPASGTRSDGAPRPARGGFGAARYDK